MKKHAFLILLIQFLVTAVLRSQRLPLECRTVSSSHDFLRDIPRENFNVLEGTRVIKVFVVIYANDNGTSQAISEETLKTELSFSNNIYNAGGICFSIVGIEFRNSTAFNNPSYPTSYTSEQVSGAFTVFVVNSIDGQSGNSGTFGWAPSIPSRYMVTKNAGFGTRRTFIHEMGHAFGLEHTFKGTGDDPDNPGCDELVNGNNGSTCGDFVTDTPADPYEKCGTAINGCTFPYTAPNCEDANSQSYSPQMNNFMSYWANYNCNRTVFTSGQFGRMQNVIDNNATLASFLAPDNLNITNASFSSGFVKQAAKNVINVGNINSAGNYSLSGNVQASFSSSEIIIKPGFTATPSGTGVVRILASNCQ